MPRPCPYVGCRHNLYLDVRSDGTIKRTFPGTRPDEMIESCSLDVAARGEMVLERVAALMGVTRERVRQIEARLLQQLHSAMERAGVRPDDN